MKQGALPDFLQPRFIPVSPCMVRHNNLTFSEREREAWRNGDHVLAPAIHNTLLPGDDRRPGRKAATPS